MGGIISPFFIVCVDILRSLLYIISVESETVNKTEEFKMKNVIAKLKREIGESLVWMCSMDYEMFGCISGETVECFTAQGVVFPQELKKFVR